MVDTETTAPGAGARTGAGAMAVVLACDFMITLDFFVVNVALPAIRHDLGAGEAAVQLVVVGYGLAFAAGLITWGRLGDIHGRRRLFALGLGLFTAASLACGLAPTAGALVAARVSQGVAAGIMAPQVLAILGTAYSGADRVRAFAAAGLVKGMAGVFGQLLGGALIAVDADGIGWRLCFLVNLPIGLAALALTPRLVPESRVDGPSRLDAQGAVLATAGLVAVVLPLVEGREQGWPPWSWPCLASGVVLLAAFAAHQRALTARDGAPLVDTRLFSDPGFTFGAAATTAYFAAMGAFLLVLALYLQDGLGLGPLGAGLFYTVLGVGFFLSAGRAPRLVARFGGPRVIAAGAATLVVGWIALGGTVTAVGAAPAVWLAPALLVCGAGMGLVMTQLSAVAIAAVPARHVGSASGVLNTAVQVGSALGVAGVGVVFYGALAGPGGHPAALTSSLVGLIALGALIAARALRAARPRPTPNPQME